MTKFIDIQRDTVMEHDLCILVSMFLFISAIYGYFFIR